jgi:tetratricopeptide (TPR) repeat protein
MHAGPAAPALRTRSTETAPKPSPRAFPRAATSAALALLALLQASHVRADNPLDEDNQKLAERVAHLGQKPEAVLPLLSLFERWDQSTPAKTRALLEKLALDRRLAPPLRVLVETMLADARARLGDPDALGKRFEELGYVTRWRVIGPFDNEGKTGFDKETPPEQKRMEAPDLQASYPGRERPVSWRQFPDIVRRGYISLGSIMRPRENVCGYAETFVYSERARPLTLFVGSGGASKVYWNGKEALRDAAYRLPSADRNAVMVAARKGANRVLVKVCVTNSAFGFNLRIGEADGSVAKGLRVETTSTEALDIASDRSPPPKGVAPVPPLQALELAAKHTPESAAALADLARYLRETGADDPAERRAKQLATRAVELEPSLEHLRLACELSEQRGELMRFAQKAKELFPDDPASLLLRAKVLATGPTPEEALPLLARVPETDQGWPAAQVIRAQVLRELDLPGTARSVIEAALAKLGDTTQLLRQLAELANATGAQDLSIAARKRLLALRFDDSSSRQVLITDAMQRGATAEVLDHVESLAKLSPGTADSLLYIAGLYDGLGRDDMVLSTYRHAMDLVPESPEVLVGYGRMLLRAERPELAAEAFARALALKPQDAATRELLEQIKPKRRDDEAYAMASEKILAARGKSPGYSTTVLMDLTVNTVFDNGLGSSFHQHAAEVHDEEGARQYRSYAIQYDPDSQRVDLRLARVYRKDGHELESVRTAEQQLGEPWYRIYYDTRALIVVFPDLEPGDVVELRYRVDDIAHRNLFADYYGDLHIWQRAVPTVRSEYVLITPASRQFYVSAPTLPGLAHKQQTLGNRRIDYYAADDVPAIGTEGEMPGITEVSAYLHVSTYKSWQDVGRWYWGLIKDQLYADEALKRTVRDLTKDAKSEREKVDRIHDWVVQNTRYVGLEFGIHGYMPYRVPLIVQRGFGDCKDKASLLYTMLREAGIDARIVLTRTRHNGAISEVPASLAIFDHAITYVPAFDLYLDGTAEHSGAEELPVQDQGVTVLQVWPDGAELHTTPVFDAERNDKRVRTLRVQLSSDGSGRVEGEEIVSGAQAAGYREYYQAPGTRAERFERNLAGLYPGLKLESQRFDSLESLEQPVRYGYRIFAPQLAHWDGDELRVEPSVMHDLVQDMARLPERRHPLDLQGKRLYIEERSVRIPAGMHASALPAGGEVSSPFGRLAIAFSQSGGTVTARTELLVARDRIAQSEYPAYRKWIEAADQLLKQRIGLRKDQNR